MAATTELIDALEDTSKRLAELNGQITPLLSLKEQIEHMLQSADAKSEERNAKQNSLFMRHNSKIEYAIDKAVKPVNRVASRAFIIWMSGIALLSICITSAFWGFIRPITDPYAIEAWEAKYAQRTAELDDRETHVKETEREAEEAKQEADTALAVLKQDQEDTARLKEELLPKVNVMKRIRLQGRHDFASNYLPSRDHLGKPIRGKHYYFELFNSEAQLVMAKDRFMIVFS